LGAFNHVLTLVAFVFAVSLAQVLVRISALIAAREKITYSGLSALAMSNAILLIYSNWLAFWELRGATDWNLLSISVMFLFSLSVCFISTLAAPQTQGDAPFDMESFYWRQRKIYHWSWISCEALAIGANLLFPTSPMASKLGSENLVNLATFAPIILALAVPRRWAQWVGGAVLFAVNLTFLVVFERQLR